MKTIVGLYMQEDDATKAVETLESVGFSVASMRILHSAGAIWQYLCCMPHRIPLRDSAIGAVVGVTIYSLAVVIAAVGKKPVGLEQNRTLGALLFFVTAGAALGGLLGFFFGLGNLEEESRLYILGISLGGVLLVVRTADEHAERAMDALRQTDAEGVKICWYKSDQPARHGRHRHQDRLSLR